MSLEAMLDEERRDVLALLEASSKAKAAAKAAERASSPFANQRMPVRSMLDVGDAPSVRRSSAGSGSPSSTRKPVRSMLDITSPPLSPPPIRSMLDVSSNSNGNSSSNEKVHTTVSTRSAQTSPTDPNQRTKTQHPRSLSDAASRPSEFGPRSSSGRKEDAYQFSGYLPTNLGAVMPKRNTQGGKKSSLPNAMSEVFGSRDRGRHSIASTGIGMGNSKSKSPHNRFSLRSSSPSLGSDTDLVLDNGTVIDSNNAYRKLSDANLAQSKGGLSVLAEKSQRRRAANNVGDGPSGSRLQKDYTVADGEHGLSSDDDSDEEGRGRKKTMRKGSDNEKSTLGMGRAKGPRTALSLMAAAEEERQQIAAKHDDHSVRSLLEPEITVTTPAGDRVLKTSKPGVHPNTSFDDATSGLNTPVDSDTEADLTDIKRAQKLSINMTSIVSTPATSRCVRTIYRGEFLQMQKEAQENHRRVRKYLVATDLSEEAAHALEWTIGTVLRDGDTLLAIYCVDEELGIAPNDGSADDALQKDQVSAIAASARPSVSTPNLNPVHTPSPLGHGSGMETSSETVSPMGRDKPKAEQERYRAVQDITDRVAKLLRKTKLQVKVVIEVIHCKSPKHLITEVIDFISPTLVILGSRGRSALKGVILGSFSNYLVTKSSVPVMVARKRLRKHTKYKRPPVRLANNLANPVVKSLASAKID
ncbi:uncharacterized protein LY89DRAFT_576764 [Mollisia scopiformis]|uniref:UspA domain-containing protein n=1 Tax=Mollisia scopiformis TaxID=149040 RepID=A0A194XPB5_MOLSC|nr:uncharacterized protein LY89DRAFT_576764 [Mollisia scopiformis]KUJ22090.1 hypothetical protein LY89DRAFT_576764 [Mollisia scopiformis]